MTRLIDADALKLDIACVYGSNPKYLNWLNNAPTVDAVPVVRCKDCKHRDPEDKKCDCGHGIMWQLPRDDDWYCADAERKEE